MRSFHRSGNGAVLVTLENAGNLGRRRGVVQLLLELWVPNHVNEREEGLEVGLLVRRSKAADELDRVEVARPKADGLGKAHEAHAGLHGALVEALVRHGKAR